MKNIVVVALVVFTQMAMGQDFKSLASTPPMGWNSWNSFGKDINEQMVKEIIDAIVNEGLLDAGYIYVVIDGGWRDTKLGTNGELLPHPVKFPHGIKPLADYAHSRGLKFGLHTVPGTFDCGGDSVGGYGHEEIQLQQFVDWGVDLIKLDKCKFDKTFKWDEEVLKETYIKWSKLIKNSGRDIVFSISAYKYRDWYQGICHMARTTLDIDATVYGKAVFDSDSTDKGFKSVMAIAEENNMAAKFAGNGYWNDPDMLVTGNKGITVEEQKAHFALWCIMSAPLMLGNDPRIMEQDEKDIILNEECIAIDQDATEQGKRIRVDGDREIWAKKLQDGDVAVLLLNRNKQNKQAIDLKFEDIGIDKKVKIRDVFDKKDLGRFSQSLSRVVEPGTGSFLIISQH